MGEPIKLQRGDKVMVVYGPNHARQLATEGWGPVTEVVETETELGDPEGTEDPKETSDAPKATKKVKGKVKDESAGNG